MALAINLFGNPAGSGVVGQQVLWWLWAVDFGGPPQHSPPFVFSLTGGTMPPGMALAETRLTCLMDFSCGLSAICAIRGIPTLAGSYFPVFHVTSGDGASATATIHLPVNASQVAANQLTPAMPGTPYSFTFTNDYSINSGYGAGPYSFAFAPSGGTSAPWINLSSAGHVSGTPVLFQNPYQTTQAAWLYIIVTSASGPNPYILNPIPIDIAPFVLSAGSPPPGIVGVPYSYAFPVTGGSGLVVADVSLSFVGLPAGALPPGLSFNGLGSIVGTPTTAGTYTFSALLADETIFVPGPDRTIAQAIIAPGTITIAVAPPPSISCDSPPNGIVEVPYTHTFPASAGVAPYTFAIIVGALPVGLTLDTATGIVSGTPISAAIYSFTVQVTDSVAGTASANCSIAVNIDVLTLEAWIQDTADPAQPPLNLPRQYSTNDGSLIGVLDGVNNIFVIATNDLVTDFMLFYNGLEMTQEADYDWLCTQNFSCGPWVTTITMKAGQYPNVGDVLTAEVFAS